ncbi:ABC1 domain-containing protein [Psidium guajava]|nr:ABC1 domain-containing protein [Psidium guajava]
MASGQTVSAILSSSVMEDDVESSDGSEDTYLDGQHHPQARGNLSRLYVCNSSFSYADVCVDADVDDDDVYADFYGLGGGAGGGGADDAPGGVGDAAVVSSYLARLSVESFDGDADEELSDEKERLPGGGAAQMTSDSGEEPEWYSLPATPPRPRNRVGCGGGPAKWSFGEGPKERASESEGRECGRARKYARRRIIRERLVSSSGGESDKLKRDEHDCCNSFSGESEGGGGLMVITRPKGGRRSLCMDLEEVKACRDLGFELEHERMVEMPSRLSISGKAIGWGQGWGQGICNVKATSTKEREGWSQGLRLTRRLSCI